MTVDIATLGLEVRSDGVVTASKRLRAMGNETKGVEKASSSLKMQLMALFAFMGGMYTVHKIKNYAIEVAHLAGQYQMLGIVMNTAGANANYSEKEMAIFEKQLRASGIAALESRQALSTLTVAQIDLSNAMKLGRAAQDVAVVGLTNSSAAFEKMAVAIQRGQPIMLRTLGLQVDFEKGYKKFADNLNREVASLTEKERVQSRVNVVLEEAVKYQGIYGKSMESAEKQFGSLVRHVTGYKLALGKAFQPAFLATMKQQAQYYKDMEKAISDPKIQEALEKISLFFTKAFGSALTSILSLIENINLLTDSIVTLSKIIAVGTALHFLPSIFILAGKALTWLNLQMAIFKMLVATGGKLAAFNTLLFGTSVAATATASAMGAIITALGVAFALYAGWEFGSYLMRNFESVRLAGIGLTDGLVKGFHYFRKEVKTVLAAISSGWNWLVSFMKIQYAELLIEISKGLDYLPDWMGGGAAEALLAVGNEMKKTAESGETYAQKMAKINAEYNEADALRQATIDQMVKEAYAYGKVTDAVKKEAEVLTEAEKAAAKKKREDAAAQEAADLLKKKVDDLTKAIRREKEALSESAEEQYLYNVLKEAGTDITTGAGKALAKEVQQLFSAKLIAEATSALETYAKTLAGLSKKLSEGDIDQKTFDFHFDKATAELNDFTGEVTDFTDGTINELDKLREELAKPFEFNFADEGLSQITNMMQGVKNLTGVWEEQAAALKVVGITTEDISQINERATQKQLAGYSNLFGTMSQFYDEGSKERKNLHALEMAFGAMEIALELEKMVPKAVNAILTQGEGDPYSAFGRIAAMTAIVGGLLAMAGVGFGGGGSSGSGGAKQDMTTTGTVLGSDESSKSLDNTIEMLETFRDANVAKLESIYQEMRDLNTNISGLANSIVRNIGDLTGVTVGESWAQDNPATQLFDWSIEKGNMLPIVGPILQDIFKGIGDMVNWAAEALAGGRSRITHQGIYLPEASVTDIQADQGVDARSYYVKKTHGGVGGHTRRTTHYRDIDEGTADLFNKLYVGMSESLVTLSTELGTSVQAALDYSFGEVKIDLRHLDAEEIQTKLSAWISTTMDKATNELFGEFLRKYQAIDEGLMETAYRLITTKEVLLSVFADTGQELDLTTETFLWFADGAQTAQKNIWDVTQAISDSFGGLEETYDAISNYADKFLTDAEKQENVTRKMGDMFGMDTLADLNLTLPETREGFKELVKGLDVTTESGLAAYTALINAADLADAYYSAIEEGIDKTQEIIDITKDMNNELSKFAQFGDEGFLSGVERAIIDVEEQGKKRYDKFVDNGMAVEEATQRTNEWTDAVSEFVEQEMINNTTRSLTIELLQAQGKAEEALAMQRENTIKGLRDEFGDLAGPMIEMQEEIWRLGDAEIVAAESAAFAAKMLSGLAETMSSLAIQSKIADIAGRSNQFQMEQVALELGWFENGAPSMQGIRDLVASVLGGSLSDTEIREQASALGLSVSDYLDNIGFLNDGLTDIDSALADLADTSKSAADALRGVIDSLNSQISSIESIQDLLNNIRGGGDLAPVQSMEFFENRYQQLLSEAQSGGEREVGIFTDFAREYLEFAQNYGGDYTGVAGTVETDLEALSASIAGDKTLADLYAQLEDVNARLDAVNQNTYATATGIADAIGSVMQDLLDGFQDLTPPWEDWIDETHQDFYGILESFKSLAGTAIQDMGEGFEWGEGWAGEGSGIDITQDPRTGMYNAAIFGAGEERLYDMAFKNIESITASRLWQMMQETPELMDFWANNPKNTLPGYAEGGVHSGGFRFVGEEGPELEFTGASRIASNNDTVQMLTQAVREGVSSINIGSNGEQHFHIYVGNEKMAHVVSKALKTDPEVQKDVRRIAVNG